MSMPKLEPERKYSYSDYLKWDDGERWELIDGIPYNMTPAPAEKHQRILGELVTEFATYLRGKTCRVYVAPFDVRLSEADDDDQTYNVVQPDLVVICDRNKIDERGCKGAPDLVVEILSPGYAAKRDKLHKFHLYQKYGVKEYWIVDPLHENVDVYRLENGKYGERQVYTKEERVPVGIFEDFAIDLQIVFAGGEAE
ncbi:Uma2 family endonuclease [Effusibacillus pohliae]|uniref:Uma2 family endonuclease n=1 Tax=Effusibacillus pohliae TaxID=232270 RepID=UPI00036444BD|nr:Uma2 family endonuclease [Effusibacillus pohliae]